MWVRASVCASCFRRAVVHNVFLQLAARAQTKKQLARVFPAPRAILSPKIAVHVMLPLLFTFAMKAAAEKVRGLSFRAKRGISLRFEFKKREILASLGMTK
jgi:hypothetical protein